MKKALFFGDFWLRPEAYREKDIPHGELTEKSLIITRSVLFHQNIRMLLKILFLKRCETNVDSLRLLIDNKQIICPVVNHIEDETCPWSWAPGCSWSSFIATAKLNFVPSNINLTFIGNSISLHMEPSHNVENIPFAVCTQPLYWYVDWLNLIEFIEIWKSQGVSYFFFYVHTISPLVAEILQYYVSKGTATVIPWRSFPRRNGVDPNQSVYRLAHSLAINDCLWRARGARFLAFIDLDEYIFNLNGEPLLTYIETKSIECPRCGTFVAIHRKMYYSSKRPQNDFYWRNIRFEWLTNIVYGKAEPDETQKVIVRPKTVSVLGTHFTRKSYPPYIDVNLNSSEIALFHASHKWSEETPQENGTAVTFFGSTLAQLNRAYGKIGKAVLKNRVLSIDRVLKKQVADCISKWYENKCKVIDLCRPNKMDWIRAEDLSDIEYQFGSASVSEQFGYPAQARCTKTTFVRAEHGYKHAPEVVERLNSSGGSGYQDGYVSEAPKEIPCHASSMSIRYIPIPRCGVEVKFCMKASPVLSDF